MEGLDDRCRELGTKFVWVARWEGKVVNVVTEEKRERSRGAICWEEGFLVDAGTALGAPWIIEDIACGNIIGIGLESITTLKTRNVYQ